jgi:glyoxylase-like metal-dependent hydrolase (beta-lactamase superfamily II)
MTDILPKQPTINSKIRVQILSGGFLHLPMKYFVAGSDPNDVRRVPSMSWLLEHEPTGQKVIFDLGIRKDIEKYTPAVFERLQNVIKSEVPKDVFASLTQRHIDPSSDIRAIIFSHLHYDHIGDPSKFGPKTEFLIGPGAKQLLHGPDSYPCNAFSHFDSKLLPKDRTVELPPADDRSFWAPLGPFPDVHDFFGDQSMYIINAPGHCPGHINLLVRSDVNQWMLLAGDTTHDTRILNGIGMTAVYLDEKTGRSKCAHHDKELAEIHLQRVREMRKLENVQVILAHDNAIYNSLCDRFGPGLQT